MSRAFRLPVRRVAVDLAVILGVMGVLGANHAFSVVTPEMVMAAGHPAMNPLLSYPVTAVHLNWTHLVRNLAGYLAATVLAYYLCTRAGVADWYYASFATVLVVVPPASSLLVYDVFRRLGPEQVFVVVGFSNVVYALVGFLFVALFASLSSVHPLPSVGVVALFAIAASAVQVLWVLWYPGTAVQAIAIGVAVALLGMVLIQMEATSPRDWRRFARHLSFYGALFLLHSVFLVGQFPAIGLDLAAGVTVFSHLVGFSLGATIGLTLAVVLQVFPTRAHVARGGFDPDETFQLSVTLLGAAVLVVAVVSGVLGGVATLVDPAVVSTAFAVDLVAVVSAVPLLGLGFVYLGQIR